MVAVGELVKSPSVSTVVVGDIDIDRAQQFCRGLASDKVSAVELDAGEHQALVDAMRDSDLVCNFIGPYYRYGAPVLRAAIEARCNFLDVNDDYDATADALALHEDAQDAGITAIVGMGATPGLVNIAARRGADKLDQVDEIHLRWNVSTADLHDWEETATVDHIFHAVTDSHPQYMNGRWVDTQGMSGQEQAYLPVLGEVDIYYLGNTPAITLPRYIQGVKTVTTKGGFAGLDDFTRSLRDLGLLGTDEMQVQGRPLTLRDISTELLSTLADREPEAVPPVGFVAQVSVSGTRKTEPVKFHYELADSRSFVHCSGICAAIGTITLAQDEIQGPGVFAPEACMDPGVFFQRLTGYGIELRETQILTQDLLGRDRGLSLKKQRINQ
jgi:saccharopine dehydrogenase-like NADP-dependent oxidoreductase